jgi:hypothetical protein
MLRRLRAACHHLVRLARALWNMPRAWKTLYTIAERIEAMATNQELADRITKLETDVPKLIVERDTLRQQTIDQAKVIDGLQQQAAASQASVDAAAAVVASPVDDAAIGRLDAIDKLVNPAG